MQNVSQMLSLTAKCHPFPHFKMKTLEKVGHFNLKMACYFQCPCSLLVRLGGMTFFFFLILIVFNSVGQWTVQS